MLKHEYNINSEHFRASIAISKLYPAIPAEHARTQFMLAKVLRMGGKAVDPNEEVIAKTMATSLMNTYHASNGRSDYKACSEASDFNDFITSKYQ